MNTKRRWMNWMIETDADAVALPWARGPRRKLVKSATRERALAA